MLVTNQKIPSISMSFLKDRAGMHVHAVLRILCVWLHPVSYTHLDVYKRQVYMRFGRLATPIINDNADYKFEIGKGVTLREGTDVAIIRCV